MKVFLKNLWNALKNGFNNVINGKKWNDKGDI